MKRKVFFNLIFVALLAMVVMAGCSGSNGKNGPAGPTGAIGTTGPQGPTGTEPVITGITPMASPNTNVTITGANFSSTQGGNKVYMNDTDAGAAISWTNTQITIKPPASLVSGNGLTQTVIVTVAVNQLPSNAIPFKLVLPGTVQPVSAMSTPYAIASTPSNMLYATDALGHIVQINQYGVAQVIATDPRQPMGIVFTNSVLYTADQFADGSGRYWINIVDPESGKVTQWRSQTVAPFMITNDTSNNLYVTYTVDGSVYQYTINGSSSHPTNLGSGTLTSPQGIAYVNGYLYIAANNNIAQYNITSHALNTTWATTLCAVGSAKGVVYWPSQNALLVSCPNNAPNNTISKVTGVGTGSGSVTQGFISDTKCYQPLGMTFDTNGNLYIGNSNDLVVTKVTFTGAGAPNTISLFAAGPYPPPSGQGKNAQDSAGNVYMPVTWVRPLIVKFTPDNKTSIYALNDTIGSGLAYGCTFSSNGVLLIADSGAQKIDTAPAGGGTITPWIDVSSLGFPIDVAIDGSGNVFIDINGNIIAKYSASGTQVSASFVSGLTGVLSFIAGSNSLTIPDYIATTLYNASSAGSGPVTPTPIVNNIALYGVSSSPSGRLYGIDGNNIFLINTANGAISFVTSVPGFHINALPDGSLLTELSYIFINRIYP